MTVANVAASHCKKAMKLGLSLIRRGFNSSKCKTMTKMAVARIKLLRNKREALVKQMRRDIALLLQSGQDATARIRVEHVIREQNIMAANEILELFCELVARRLTIIAKQRECPADLKEGIASLIFAAPRCSDIPELLAIRDIFEKKYGKDFVSTATDLRPNSGVNRMLIEKLSVRTPSGQLKLKVMKEIAKEYQIEWDTTESEKELLQPPEELIEGPRTFVSASSLPVKPIAKQSTETDKQRTTICSEGDADHFEDTASAAQAAAESAKKAVAAAEAAAYLAKTAHNLQVSNNMNVYSVNKQDHGSLLDNPTGIFMPYHSQSFGGSHYSSNEDKVSTKDAEKANRRHSYNAASSHSDIKFDESDCDEEIDLEHPPSAEMDLLPNRPAPQVPSTNLKQVPIPRIHPKLPDYDGLAARFEALKYHKKSKT
ncbi:uncharacterized protein LOC127799937 [Diospyros lotus]|uniref:uncharacterized protein LOC127799937 n=1 Tax=Diospyros lotus TaxID=55363 RepID=UPI00224DAF8B|nr:uncharacterized protein LOC127799937 [Diospyros lotus]